MYYEPRIFGFRVHAGATLARWQAEQRELMKDRLRSEGLDTGFEEEERAEQMEASDEEDENGGGGAGQDGGGIDDLFEGQGMVQIAR